MQTSTFSEKLLHQRAGPMLYSPRAEVAQSVEQGTENPRVSGSIPLLGTIFSYEYSVVQELPYRKQTELT
jgi:hypothetical protein